MKIYKLKNSREVPNAGGYYNNLRIGLPVQEEMVNDICITSPGTYEFVALNSRVLRKALLDNPEITKQLLGIIVKDATIKARTEKKKEKEESNG